MRSLRFAFIIACIAGISACEKESLLSGAPGEYVGFLLQSDVSKSEQFLTRAVIRGAEGDAASLELEVKSTIGENRWHLELKVDGKDTLKLKAPDAFEGERRLRKTGNDDGCFSATESVPETRLCFDGRELSIDAGRTGGGSLTLVLERHDPSQQPPLEDPQGFSAMQLFERAMDQGFDTRAEFERVIQARLGARNARMNLLPHFSFNTFFTFVNFQPIGLIRAVGDLAPFLLPTRWFRAKQASKMAEHELLAWMIMKADAANITEGLIHALLRDERAIARLAVHRDSVSGIRDQILGRERLGLVPPGSSDDLTSLLNQLDQTVLYLEQAIAGGYSALAMSAGFMNPRAIARVEGEIISSIENPPTEAELEAAVPAALGRSLELRQMELLLSQAKLGKISRYFNWIDPSGGEAGGALGFGLPSYFQIGNSQIHELIEQQRKLQAVVLQKIRASTVDLQASRRSHELAVSEAAVQQRRIDRLLGKLKLGISISLMELVNALQGRMKADLDQNDAEFAYLVATSKLNRVLFAGPYARITIYRDDRP